MNQYNTTNKYLPYVICLRGHTPEPPEVQYKFISNNLYYNLTTFYNSLYQNGYTSESKMLQVTGTTRNDLVMESIYVTNNNKVKVRCKHPSGIPYTMDYNALTGTFATMAKHLEFLIPSDLLSSLATAYPENVIIEEQ